MPVISRREQTFLCQIYFYEAISFQKPFEDREYIIKVIEIDVIAIKAKTESFQVVKLILLIFLLNVCIFP